MRFWQLARRAEKTNIPYSDEHETILDAALSTNSSSEVDDNTVKTKETADSSIFTEETVKEIAQTDHQQDELSVNSELRTTHLKKTQLLDQETVCEDKHDTNQDSNNQTIISDSYHEDDEINESLESTSTIGNSAFNKYEGKYSYYVPPKSLKQRIEARSEKENSSILTKSNENNSDSSEGGNVENKDFTNIDSEYENNTSTQGEELVNYENKVLFIKKESDSCVSKHNSKDDVHSTTSINTEQPSKYVKNEEIIPMCLIIIDETYEDIKETIKLVDGLGVVQIINKEEDPFIQILNHLQSLKSVASMHIFSQVTPGCLYLGGEELFIDTLNSNKNTILRSWGDYFSKQGVMYIYDSEFTETEVGREAKRTLEMLIGVTIIIPASNVGVSIQPINMDSSWMEDSAIDDENDLLSYLEDPKQGSNCNSYVVNKLSTASINLKLAGIDCPIIIVALQISDGLLLLSRSDQITYKQRPKVGCRIVVQGETKRLIEELRHIKYLTSNKDSVIIRATVFTIEKDRLHDITVIAKRKDEESNEDSDVRIEPARGVLNSHSERIFLNIVVSPEVNIHFDKISKLYFICEGFQDLLLFKKYNNDKLNGLYVCNFTSLRFSTSEIILTNDSANMIQEACIESGEISINKICTIIIDTSENYAPQLTEEGWCQASISSSSSYAVVGDYINITLSFAEPLFVSGNPSIVIQLDNQVRVAFYSGITGIVLDQKLRFQYQVKDYDKAISGISIQKLTSFSVNCITGVATNGASGTNVDPNIISTKRLPYIKICEQTTQLIRNCEIDNKLYSSEKLSALLSVEADGTQIQPSINLDEIFPTVLKREYSFIVVRSWNKLLEEKIHLIQYNARYFADGGYYGRNSWNNLKYQPIQVSKGNLSGLAIDVFATDKSIPPIEDSTMENILSQLRGHVMACGRFSYCIQDNISYIATLPGISAMYNYLGLSSILGNKDQQPITYDIKSNAVLAMDLHSSYKKKDDLLEKAIQHGMSTQVLSQFKSLVLPEDS